jgi:hypothetical protein
MAVTCPLTELPLRAFLVIYAHEFFVEVAKRGHTCLANRKGPGVKEAPVEP